MGNGNAMTVLMMLVLTVSACGFWQPEQQAAAPEATQRGALIRELTMLYSTKCAGLSMNPFHDPEGKRLYGGVMTDWYKQVVDAPTGEAARIGPVDLTGKYIYCTAAGNTLGADYYFLRKDADEVVRVVIGDLGYPTARGFGDWVKMEWKTSEWTPGHGTIVLTAPGRTQLTPLDELVLHVHVLPSSDGVQ